MTTNLYSVAQADLFAENVPLRLTAINLPELLKQTEGVSDERLVEIFLDAAATFYSISAVIAGRKINGYALLQKLIADSN